MPEGHQFTTIARESASTIAIGQIKQQIALGLMKPGDKLPSEQALATMLGISRPTVREALRALTSMNIVETRRGEGSFITSLKLKDLFKPLGFLLSFDNDALAQLFEARVFVEVGLCRLAATRVQQDDITQLRALAKSYSDNIDDLDRCIDIDIEFHQRIATCARNDILAHVLDGFAQLSKESRRRTGNDRTMRVDSNHDHELIIEALAGGDPMAAEQRMRQHLARVSSRLEPGKNKYAAPE